MYFMFKNHIKCQRNGVLTYLNVIKIIKCTTAKQQVNTKIKINPVLQH